MKEIRNTNQVVVNNNCSSEELKILEKLNKLGMLKTNKKRKPRMEAQIAPQMLQPGLPLGMGRIPTPLIREQAPTEALTRASIDEINRQTATNLATQRQQLVDEVRAIRTDRFPEPQRFRPNVEVETPFTGVEGQGDAEKQSIGEQVDTKEDQGDFTQVGSSEASAKSNVDVTAEGYGFAPEKEDVWARLERRYPEEALGARFSGLGFSDNSNTGIRVVKNDPNEKKLSEMAMKYRPRIQGIGIQSKVTPEPQAQPQAQAQPVEKPKPKAKAKPKKDIVFEEVDEL
jgi:hypothetical protein